MTSPLKTRGPRDARNGSHRSYGAGVQLKPEHFMKTLIQSFLLLFLPLNLIAADKPAPPPADPPSIVFRELRYDGKVSDDEARFAIEITAESSGKQEAAATLFDGELALSPPKLP